MEGVERAQNCFFEESEGYDKLKNEIMQIDDAICFTVKALMKLEERVESLEREITKLNNWTFNLNKLD